MKLKTFALSDGENPLHYQSDKEGWLREVIHHVKARGVPVAGELVADLNLTKLAPEYFLQGELKFTLKQPCDRCAEEFERPVRHRFGVAMAELPKNVELEPDEGDVTYFEHGEIDLSPLIEEQLVLSQPYQALCKPDCAGIQTENKKEAESSGPFSVLKKLKK